MSKKLFIMVVSAMMFSCNQPKKINLKVEGVEKGTAFLISKKVMDTVFSGVVSDNIVLDLSGKDEKSFPGKYIFSVENKKVRGYVVLSQGDNITITIDEDQQKFDVKSNFTKKMDDFIAKNPELASIKIMISEKSESLIAITKEYREIVSTGDKLKIEEKVKEHDALSDTLTMCADRVIDIIYPTFFESKTKSADDLFIFSEYLNSSSYMKNSEKITKIIDLYNEYKKLFDKDFISEAIVSLEARKEVLVNSEKVKIGNDFVEIESLGIDRQTTVKLSEEVKKHKVILLKFWASWCGPCIRSIPSTLDLYNKYSKKGMQVFAVSLDKEGKEEAWKKAIEDNKIGSWIHCSDLKFWYGESSKKYGVQGIPAEFLIVDGKIVSENNTSKEDLEVKIKEALGLKK